MTYNGPERRVENAAYAALEIVAARMADVIQHPSAYEKHEKQNVLREYHNAVSKINSPPPAGHQPSSMETHA